MFFIALLESFLAKFFFFDDMLSSKNQARNEIFIVREFTVDSLEQTK